MQELTAAATQAIRDMAQRYGASEDGVRTLLFAVSAGGGSMAQFYHRDFGGGGQWMRGGMTMVGDMFDAGLQARVNNLCTELSSLLASQDVFVPPPRQGSVPSGSAGSAGSGSTGGTSYGSGAWWPSDLGSPSSTGGQNDSQYAYFPDTRRLAIREGGRVTLYDTLDHRIGGVQQQQGGPSGSLSFSSQFGTFSVGSLPLVSDGSSSHHAAQPAPARDRTPAYSNPAPAYNPDFSPGYDPPPAREHGGSGRGKHDEILSAIERLGDLHRKGILTDGEFQSKKAELLAKL